MLREYGFVTPRSQLATRAEIQRVAKETDVRIIGCNCIGVTNAATRMDTFFQSRQRMVRPPLGPIAMLTQSGTIGIGYMDEIGPGRATGRVQSARHAATGQRPGYLHDQ